MKKLLAMFLSLVFLSGCAWLLDQIPQPPVPSPTPSPVPSPTPSPGPTPEPSPSPTPCAPPDLETNTCLAPGASGAPRDGRRVAEVDAAQRAVQTRYPGRFGPSPRGDASFRINDPLTGLPLPQDDPALWYLDAVIAELQAGGLCARREGEEIAVADPESGAYENYAAVIQNLGPRTSYGAGMYRAWCRVVAPSPPPVASCPLEAPAVAKFRLHVSSASTFPRGRRVDATPVAAGEAWCASQGFLDPDGSGQGWCPYGAEGGAQELACQAREGPYRWSQRETTVWLDLPADDDNVLQAWIAANYSGTVRVCAATGACSEVDVRP
jgi:hypothetical protein